MNEKKPRHDSFSSIIQITAQVQPLISVSHQVKTKSTSYTMIHQSKLLLAEKQVHIVCYSFDGIVFVKINTGQHQRHLVEGHLLPCLNTASDCGGYLFGSGTFTSAFMFLDFILLQNNIKRKEDRTNVICVSTVGQVKCSSNNMRIEVKRRCPDSLGYSAYSLYLDEKSCKPWLFTKYQVVFSFPITACGNVEKVINLKQTFLLLLPPTSAKCPFFSSTNQTEGNRQGSVFQHPPS